VFHFLQDLGLKEKERMSEQVHSRGERGGKEVKKKAQAQTSASTRWAISITDVMNFASSGVLSDEISAASAAASCAVMWTLARFDAPTCLPAAAAYRCRLRPPISRRGAPVCVSCLPRVRAHDDFGDSEPPAVLFALIFGWAAATGGCFGGLAFAFGAGFGAGFGPATLAFGAAFGPAFGPAFGCAAGGGEGDSADSL
jgi:hypothetical protein